MLSFGEDHCGVRTWHPCGIVYLLFNLLSEFASIYPVTRPGTYAWSF